MPYRSFTSTSDDKLTIGVNTQSDWTIGVLLINHGLATFMLHLTPDDLMSLREIIGQSIETLQEKPDNSVKFVEKEKSVENDSEELKTD